MKIKKTNLLFYSVMSLLLLTDIVYGVGTEWVWDSGYKMTFPHETDANIFLWLASVIVMIWVFKSAKRFRHFSSSVILVVAITVALSILWMVQSILAGETIFTILVRQYSPFLLVFVSTLVLGDDELIFGKSLQVARIVMLVGFALTIYTELNFLTTYGFTVRILSSTVHVYYWEALLSWLFYIFNIDEKNDKWVSRIGTLMLLTAAFLTLSRSNIIVALLCTFLYFRRPYFARQIKFGAYVQIIITIGIGIWLFGWLVPDAYSSMLERLFSDSRSGQYEQFFSQVSWWELFVGQGIGATYTFSRFEKFAYVDNANLVMAFRYGIIPTAGMLILLINSLWVAFKKRRSQTWQIILIWLLATNGLSVYLNYKISWGYFLIWLSVGRILSRRSQSISLKRGRK